MNQRLINYAINNLIVPKINQILTMFSVVVPTTKYENKIDDNTAVYLHELDDKTIVQYLRKYPIPITDNFQFANLLFNEKFAIGSKYYKTNTTDTLYKYQVSITDIPEDIK
jgi:hypothetical protein